MGDVFDLNNFQTNFMVEVACTWRSSVNSSIEKIVSNIIIVRISLTVA